MSGDYSRFVYEPSRDYNGVRLQQGRPLTDWDWNDWVAQVNRRTQAGSFDTFGGAAVVPLTTPDGFKPTLDAGGALQIGHGRIYVDGLLAENHGLAPLQWDAALAELHGSSPVPYAKQPYLPNATALPTAAGPHVIYVDVWEREVTQFEAPDLVDKALGVDTTTRVQTVWQVKVLANTQSTGLACDTDPSALPGWATLTAPSAGRLTTATAIYGSDSPCLIPPAGGYTGLENQLYRVEIHDGGAPGTATFKWSRDNASVETRVTRFVDTGTLVVESVGKDGVLRFNDGDWVEVLDDWLELDNLPGQLRRIVVGGGVDDATRTITLESPVNAGVFPVDAQGRPDPARHTRLRRWDQKDQVLRTDTAQPTVYVDLDSSGDTGLITVPVSGTVTLALENGIVVSFNVDPAGGVFKSGDWWVFAARAADASIELLDHTPPRGIHHHYARLGLYTPGSTPTDCRQFWPPSFGTDSCACTICVSPQAHAQNSPSIQQAIDTVIAKGGGTVCLEAGDYTLREALKIEKAATLTLRGQGKVTRLLAPTAAVTITNGLDVTVEDLAIISSSETGETGFAAIKATDMQDLRLQRLTIEAANRQKTSTGAIALAGRHTRVRVRDNLILAPFGLFSDTGSAVISDLTVKGGIAIQELLIDDNSFKCSEAGITLQLSTQPSALLRINGNYIVSAGAVGIKLSASGTVEGDAQITGNRLVVAGTGISAGLSGLRILDNDILHTGTTAAAAAAQFGIIVPTLRGTVTSPGDCHILGNRIGGFNGAGIALEAVLGKVQIKQNQISKCGGGIGVFDPGGVELLSIENNQISDIDINPRNSKQALLVGIGVFGARAVSVTGNSIIRFGLTATIPNLLAAAITLQQCDGVEISGNELAEIGPAETFAGAVVGVLVRQPFADVKVHDNRIRRDSQPHDGDASIWVGVWIIGDPAAVSGSAASSTAETTTTETFHIENAPMAANVQVMRDFVAKTGTVAATGTAPVGAATAAPAASTVTPMPSQTCVRGNQISNRGGFSSVWIGPVANCQLTDNRCLHTTATNSLGVNTVVDIFVAAATLAVANNRVSGPKGSSSMALVAPDNRYTVLGNITSGDIMMHNAVAQTPWFALPQPWSPLNVKAP